LQSTPPCATGTLGTTAVASAAFEDQQQTPDLDQAVLAAGEVDRRQAQVGAGRRVGTGADQGPGGLHVVVFGGAVEGGRPVVGGRPRVGAGGEEQFDGAH